MKVSDISHMFPISKNNKFKYEIYACLLNNQDIYQQYKIMVKKIKQLDNILISWDDFKKMYDKYNKLNIIYNTKINEIIMLKEKEFENNNEKLADLEQLAYLFDSIENFKSSYEFDEFIKYCKELNIFNDDIINKFKKLVNKFINL